MNSNWLESAAVVLPLTNVDTDQIMPARFLSRLDKTGYEDALFIDRRANPEFVLNKPEAKVAKILLAGRNFGIGSSREHAVWGLLDWGFRAVFAPAFGDIFAANAAECGLLCGVLEDEELERLSKIVNSSVALITVDLMHERLNVGEERFGFSVNSRAKRLIFRGGDATTVTLRQNIRNLETFEEGRPRWKPVVPSAAR